MESWLSHPAVQAGIAPLVAGLLVAAIGMPLRLAGLAAAAGFATALYLTGNFVFDPLTALRKLALAGMGAGLLGLVADLAFKPARTAGIMLGLLAGAASAWVFSAVLMQKPPLAAVGHGVGIGLLVLVTVAFMLELHSHPIRAGAAGVGLGLGAGIGAILSASALIGMYGLALGAACGGFLLVAMIFGHRVVAGASFTLAAGVIASLLASGALLLAKLPWHAAAALALVPVAVRLPLPERAHPALQAVVASLYAAAVAGGACALAWMASRG
jgi:hypothetical protein